MDLLRVSGISKRIGNDFIVKEISFTQQRLEKIAIAGETGSGKSTLLKIIAGLVQPDEGEVFFEEEKLPGPDEKLLPGHPDVAYLSQHFELRNNYRVEELLQYANKLSEEEAAIVHQVCRIDHLLKRRTDQLSGGERQRIATARLLLSSPKLFLLDEPFSNLDAIHKEILKNVISDISEKLSITCMLISHDPLDILSWADTVLILKDGRIIQQGSSKEIYSQPVDEYTASLFGTYNLLTAAQAKAFGFSEMKANGKRMFIRPENFKIFSKQDGVAGQVNEVTFFGSYFEIEVYLQDGLILIKAAVCKFKKGDTVFVAFAPGSVWYV
jgi:ABC-type sugar transport system ATPase subunit